MLPGQGLPGILLLPEKGIFQSNNQIVNISNFCIVCDVRSKKFCERSSRTARRRVIQSPAGPTPDVDWDHAQKLVRTDEFDPLPRTDEREYEEVRDETIHRLLD